MQRAGIPPTSVPKTAEDGDDGCFITSVAIAAATDSTIIGTILGGDPVGAAVGDAHNSNDKVEADQLPNDEPSPEFDDDPDTPEEPSEEEASEDDEDD